MKITSLFVCDPQTLVIEGLHRVLALTDDIRITGTASGVQEALPLVRQQKPDVILLDQQGGWRQAMHAVSQFKTVSESSHTILWSGDLAEVEGYRALQFGVRALLKKTLPSPAILERSRAVSAGHTWMETPAPQGAGGLGIRRTLHR